MIKVLHLNVSEIVFKAYLIYLEVVRLIQHDEVHTKDWMKSSR